MRALHDVAAKHLDFMSRANNIQACSSQRVRCMYCMSMAGAVHTEDTRYKELQSRPASCLSSRRGILSLQVRSEHSKGNNNRARAVHEAGRNSKRASGLRAWPLQFDTLEHVFDWKHVLKAVPFRRYTSWDEPDMHANTSRSAPPACHTAV